MKLESVPLGPNTSGTPPSSPLRARRNGSARRLRCHGGDRDRGHHFSVATRTLRRAAAAYAARAARPCLRGLPRPLLHPARPDQAVCVEECTVQQGEHTLHVPRFGPADLLEPPERAPQVRLDVPREDDHGHLRADINALRAGLRADLAGLRSMVYEPIFAPCVLNDPGPPLQGFHEAAAPPRRPAGSSSPRRPL